MPLQHGEVHRTVEAELALRPSGEADAAVVGQVDVLGEHPCALNVDDAAPHDRVDFGAELELGGVAHLEPAGLEREVTSDAAVRAAEQTAAELRQVELERDAFVVQDELAAHDHEALDRDQQSMTAAATAAAAELGDVVPPGTERG